MAIDLNAFPAALRLKQIKLGEQFGSKDTLDQANQTLAALARHAAALAGQGFIDAGTEGLTDARDLLVDAGVGREAAKGQKKITSQGYVDALSAGQAVRMKARSILGNVQDDLEESVAPEAPDAARAVAIALKQTIVARDDAEGLAKQLDRLAETLALAAVSPVAQARGGAAALDALDNAAKSLRKADQDDAGVRGTPAETQRLDQIDGIIVHLTRRARKAALAAAKELGTPALAAEFKLDKLYRSRNAGSPQDTEEHDGEADDDDGADPAPEKR